jgi:hypothetical protein
MGAEVDARPIRRGIQVKVENNQDICLNCSAVGIGYYDWVPYLICRPAKLEIKMERIPRYGEAESAKIDMAGVPSKECPNGYKSPNDRPIV